MAAQKLCIFQSLICIQKYVAHANCQTLLTGSTIPWSYWFYNIVNVMSFSKSYEFF